MKVEVVRAVEIDSRLRYEWKVVFEADATARWSQSPDWADAFQQVYRRPFDLWVVREGHDLVAAVPMSRDGSVFAGDASDAAAPVFQSPNAALALSEFAVNQPRPSRWLAVPEDSPWHARLGDQFLTDAEANLQLDLTGTFDRYLGQLSSSLRYDARRRNQFQIRAATATSVRSDVDILIQLHESRWRRRGLPGVFFGIRGRFFREWTQRAVTLGKAEILVAEQDGVTVGAACFMVNAGRTGFYQSGISTATGSLRGSPGTALVAEAIARAYDRGDHTFDFLRGDEPYKRRWKPTREAKIRRYVIPASTRLHPRELWWKTEAAAYRKLRDRFEGKGLWT